jgi:hypothetical protein
VPLSINNTNISIKHVYNLIRRLIVCLVNGHLISSMRFVQKVSGLEL